MTDRSFIRPPIGAFKAAPSNAVRFSPNLGFDHLRAQNAAGTISGEDDDRFSLAITCTFLEEGGGAGNDLLYMRQTGNSIKEGVDLTRSNEFLEVEIFTGDSLIASVPDIPAPEDTEIQLLICGKKDEGVFVFIDDELIGSDTWTTSTIDWSLIDTLGVGQIIFSPFSGRLSRYFLDLDIFYDYREQSERDIFYKQGVAQEIFHLSQPLMFFGDGQIAYQWNRVENRGTYGDFIMAGPVTDVEL